MAGPAVIVIRILPNFSAKTSNIGRFLGQLSEYHRLSYRGTAMQVFVAPHHAGHHSRQFIRHGRVVQSRDVPARAELILEALRQDGHAIAEASPHGMAPIAAIHTPEYLAFLETAWSEWRAIKGASEDVFPYVFPVRGMDHGYPTTVVGRAGYHMHDLWAPIGQHTWQVAIGSANLAGGGGRTCAERRAGRLCAVRLSGHHAFADLGGGNCFLNNAAIAAQHPRRGKARVALDAYVAAAVSLQDVAQEAKLPPVAVSLLLHQPVLAGGTRAALPDSLRGTGRAEGRSRPPDALGRPLRLPRRSRPALLS
jgi:hypothetical protein